jgi:hypothetical protein
MMVLCPTHHHQATAGAMPESEQRALKARPFNIEHGYVKGKLEVRQDYCAVEFGSVTVVGEGWFLSIDGENLVGFHIRDGNLEISLKLYDEEDTQLLEIDRNEWVSGDALPWDIEAGWKQITLRERARRICLSLDARPIPLHLNGTLWKSRRHFLLDSRGITLGGATTTVGGGFSELALVGFKLDLSAQSLSIGVAPDNPRATMVSWPSRRERLYKAREAWRKIKASQSGDAPARDVE